MATDENKDLDPLLDLFGDKAVEDLDGIKSTLKAVIEADVRQIYDDDGDVLSPKFWPETEAMAVAQIGTNAKTGNLNVRFQDKARAADQLARINGAYRNDDEVENPMEAILQGIPRDDLILMVQKLREMAGTDQADTDPDADARIPLAFNS